MDVETKINLVQKSPTEELIQDEELRTLFQSNNSPKHYIGIELSGLLHLGSLLMTGFKINDFIKAGINSSVYLADWHSFINNKFNGDWNKINDVVKYYEEAFTFFCPGVRIVKSQDLYHNNDDYWKNLIKFSKHMTLSRAVRCLTIMGRTEKEQLDLTQYLYPSMQAVDIKTLDLDIVHAGTDQRKIHMLVREIFPKMKWKVPVAIHHHLIPGLGSINDKNLNNENINQVTNQKIYNKMSKSDPKKSIFIHDDEDVIFNKLKTAWSQEGVVENNPILDYVKYLIFHEFDSFTIERPSKYGGDVTFSNYQELESEYKNSNIHPLDLKLAVGGKINEIVAPIRSHFSNKSDLFSFL
jgi:tyrosyl-tRNA synthetase